MLKTDSRRVYLKLVSLLLLVGCLLLIAPSRTAQAENGSCVPEESYCVYVCRVEGNANGNCPGGEEQCHRDYVLCMGGDHEDPMRIEQFGSGFWNILTSIF